jgi:hypothetical protein
VFFWIGWRLEAYFIYRDFWLVLVGAVVCGALINRWWSALLAFVPVVLSVGIDYDDRPSFVPVFFLVAPYLAAALALGVLLARTIRRIRVA